MSVGIQSPGMCMDFAPQIFWTAFQQDIHVFGMTIRTLVVIERAISIINSIATFPRTIANVNCLPHESIYITFPTFVLMSTEQLRRSVAICTRIRSLNSTPYSINIVERYACNKYSQHATHFLRLCTKHSHNRSQSHVSDIMAFKVRWNRTLAHRATMSFVTTVTLVIVIHECSNVPAVCDQKKISTMGMNKLLMLTLSSWKYINHDYCDLCHNWTGFPHRKLGCGPFVFECPMHKHISDSVLWPNYDLLQLCDHGNPKLRKCHHPRSSQGMHLSCFWDVRIDTNFDDYDDCKFWCARPLTTVSDCCLRKKYT